MLCYSCATVVLLGYYWGVILVYFWCTTRVLLVFYWLLLGTTGTYSCNSGGILVYYGCMVVQICCNFGSSAERTA